MSAGSNKGGPKNDINVTPLVDVVLVLLIIFMVVTPMLQRGKDVTLPKAKQQSEEKQSPGSDPLILSVTADKQAWVESDLYENDLDLQTRIKTELQKEPGRRIMLKGDASLTYADVRKVMKVSQQAGAKSVALGVEEVK